MSDLFEQDAVKMDTDVATIVGDSSLYAKVLESGNIEVLERFLAAKSKEEDRQARMEFDRNFSKMQAEFTPVAKTGEVKNKDKTRTLYKFCPLENILKAYAPIIAAHGFSYYWTEEAIEGNQSKRISCHVNGYGHERSAYIDIPIQAGNEFTNSIQQRGVSTTYGKRYSFVNAFGAIIEDEDDENAMTCLLYTSDAADE